MFSSPLFKTGLEGLAEKIASANRANALRAMASHPSTPPHEAAAARQRLQEMGHGQVGPQAAAAAAPRRAAAPTPPPQAGAVVPYGRGPSGGGQLPPGAGARALPAAGQPAALPPGPGAAAAANAAVVRRPDYGWSRPQEPQVLHTQPVNRPPGAAPSVAPAAPLDPELEAFRKMSPEERRKHLGLDHDSFLASIPSHDDIVGPTSSAGSQGAAKPGFASRAGSALKWGLGGAAAAAALNALAHEEQNAQRLVYAPMSGVTQTSTSYNPYAQYGF